MLTNNVIPDSMDLLFMAEIANIPENLYNLENAVRTAKTFYFGEGNMSTLTQSEDLFNYLTAASQVFRPAIDTKYEALMNKGEKGSFKVYFLNPIKASMSALPRPFTSLSHVSK